MSRLDELIAELCPDGVEYKMVKDICLKVCSGGTPNSRVQEYYGGEIPWLRTQEVDFKDITDTGVRITRAGLINSSAKWIPANCVIVAMYGASAARVGINKIPLTTNQACLNLEIDSLKAEYKYVYYWFASQYEDIKSLSQGAQPNLNAQKIKGYPIPIPPLPVQQEIVRILDRFTALEAELEVELEAELEARKKQYVYYRDSLLTLSGEQSNAIKWLTLGEICKSVSTGGTPLKSRTDYYGGSIPWLRTQEVKFNDITETENKIAQLGLENSSAKWIPANCVIIAISGATAARCAINKIPLTTNQHCCNLEINESLALYRFVFYWVSSQYEKLKALGQGARNDLNVGIIRQYQIPIPSLAEQKRIVAILDRFDALINDITQGLPAEIVARRKQYEYYRDKLLTFKEKIS